MRLPYYGFTLFLWRCREFFFKNKWGLLTKGHQFSLTTFQETPQILLFITWQKVVLSYEAIHAIAQFCVMKNGANSKQAANWYWKLLWQKSYFCKPSLLLFHLSYCLHLKDLNTSVGFCEVWKKHKIDKRQHTYNMTLWHVCITIARNATMCSLHYHCWVPSIYIACTFLAVLTL